MHHRTHNSENGDSSDASRLWFSYSGSDGPVLVTGKSGLVNELVNAPELKRIYCTARREKMKLAGQVTALCQQWTQNFGMYIQYISAQTTSTISNTFLKSGRQVLQRSWSFNSRLEEVLLIWNGRLVVRNAEVLLSKKLVRSFIQDQMGIHTDCEQLIEQVKTKAIQQFLSLKKCIPAARPRLVHFWSTSAQVPPDALNFQDIWSEQI